MKKLLVTGVSGFLGWNICRMASKEWDIFGTVFSRHVEIPHVKIQKVDLTNFRELRQLFQSIRPDAVIHTAAVSDINFCQTNRTESHKINVDSAINIAKLCAGQSSQCVFTSSDLVFDGLNPPYRETDNVCPVNIYGEQKVLAEDGVSKTYPETVICRMPLMFGLCGPAATSFIQPMIKAMNQGHELRLFVDEFRTPVSATTAVSGLFLALEKVTGMIHLGGGERISRYDFGRLVAKVYEIDGPKLIPCKQKDSEMMAPRPPDVSLDSSKALALGFRTRPLEKELEETRKAMGKVLSHSRT